MKFEISLSEKEKATLKQLKGKMDETTKKAVCFAKKGTDKVADFITKNTFEENEKFQKKAEKAMDPDNVCNIFKDSINEAEDFEVGIDENKDGTFKITMFLDGVPAECLADLLDELDLSNDEECPCEFCPCAADNDCDNCPYPEGKKACDEPDEEVKYSCPNCECQGMCSQCPYPEGEAACTQESVCPEKSCDQEFCPCDKPEKCTGCPWDKNE